MSMDYLDPFANDDITENGEEGKDCWHSRFTINNEERDMIDFETIG